MESMMQEDKVVELSDLLAWNKRMLALIGIWPKDNNNLRFGLSFVYVSIHVAMEYADLVQHIGNLEKILDNLSETTTYMILLVKIAVFRNNRILSQMIDAMNEDCASYKHKSLREQRIYATYNSMAKGFYKMLVPLVCTTAILYYVRPLAGYLFTTSHNATAPFNLPYRTRFFYEMTDVYRYALAYAYQAITLHLVTCGLIGTDGLMISLTLHVCGQLSILADSIVNLKKDDKNGGYPIHSKVKRHVRLIWMAKKIDTAFTIVLLGQLLGSALLICLNGFNVIVNSERTQRTSLITFAFYEASMLTFLYSYCFIGECLIQESKRVLNAFYQCSWYDMSPSQSKDLIICMARSQKPLYLTAGRFYIFSLEGFTELQRVLMRNVQLFDNDERRASIIKYESIQYLIGACSYVMVYTFGYKYYIESAFTRPSLWKKGDQKVIHISVGVEDSGVIQIPSYSQYLLSSR